MTFKAVPEDGTRIAELSTGDADLIYPLEIRQMESGAYQEYTANGQHDMFMGSWGTVTLDADYGLYPMFHSDNHGAPGNRKL